MNTENVRGKGDSLISR